MHRLRLAPRHQLLFLFLWILFVLYPNPYRIAASAYRVVHPPVDPEMVEHLSRNAPSDPEEMERFVLQEFPYQYDWKTYNVPWYFPTVSEALEAGTGDCKTRFVILASLFERENVRYEKTVSLSHFWVNYEGKEETALERAEHAWLVQDDEGRRVQMPQEDLRDVWDTFRAAFWEHMPAVRKFLLLLGPPLAILLGAGRWMNASCRRRRI